MARSCRLRENGICGAISKTIESYADTGHGWDWEQAGLVAVSRKLKAGQDNILISGSRMCRLAVGGLTPPEDTTLTLARQGQLGVRGLVGGGGLCFIKYRALSC